MGRGNKSSKPAIEARRRRLAVLLTKGKSTTEAEQILEREGYQGTDRCTLDRDLKALRDEWAKAGPEEFDRLRKTQVAILEKMEEWLLVEKLDLETVREWRAIRGDISKLYGLNREVAPTLQVNVDLDPAKMGLYNRFMHAIRWVPVTKFDQIWAIIATLAEPPTAELSPSMLPPPDSELWRDDDDPKLLKGETQA